MKKIAYISILILVVFTSCEYEIDYNEKLPEDKFVFSTFVEEDDSIKLAVMHSAKPGLYEDYYDFDDDIFKSQKRNKYNLSAKDMFVNDANVSLYVNNQLKETKKQGKYENIVFDYIPQHNDEIYFKIEHSNYPTVEQKLILDISSPQIDSTRLSKQRIGGENYMVVYIEIDDDGGDNYYMFRPSLPIYSYDATCPKVLYESHPDAYMENALNVSFGDEDEKYNHFGVFSNNKFRGQKYIIKLAYEYASYKDRNTYPYAFEVSKIDYNAYGYLSSLGKFLDMYGPTMNPIIIQNSFSNAYGFISKKKSRKINLKLNK